MILSITRAFAIFLLCSAQVDAEYDPYFGTDERANCSVGQLYCDGAISAGKCIPLAWRCDGEYDCVDRTDEPPTCPKKQCPESQFTCRTTGRCLPMGYRCDGELDCGQSPDGSVDNSDETECPQKVACPPGMHRCVDKSKCVELTRFCDGGKDCEDGSDEHSRCGRSPSQDKQKTVCKYGGVETLDEGMKCYCPAGKVPSDSDCVDEDECQRIREGHRPVCLQTCTNIVVNASTDRGFDCACHPGYRLENTTHCRAINVPKDAPATAILVTLTHIVHKKLDDLEGDPIGTLERADIQAIAFDHRRRRICWVRRRYVGSSSYSVVECTSVKDDGSFGTEKEIRTIQPKFGVEGVSVMQYDWIGNNWWFLDVVDTRIFVCAGEELQHCSTVRRRGLDKPESLVVDPTNGYAFVTEFGSKNAGIWRTTLDGKDMVRMTDGSVVHPKGVTVDPATRTVFWFDTYLEHIHSVDYDKTFHRRHIASGQAIKSMSSITVFENFIYGASSLDRLVRVDLMLDSDQKPQIFTDSIDFFNIQKLLIFHRQAQPDADHPCLKDNGGCAHICLPVYRTELDATTHTNRSVPAAVCRCQEGFRVSDDGRKCSSDYPTDEPILIFGRTHPGSIAAIFLKDVSATKDNTSVEPTAMEPMFGLRRPTSMVVDALTQTLYYSDSKNYTIFRRKIFGGAAQEALISEGLNNCEGMAFDWTASNLYWTDQGLQLVRIVNVERPQLRKTIVQGNLSNPRGIAVHPAKGFLFWTDWTDNHFVDSSSSKIERSLLDGSQRKAIVSTHIHWPNGLAVDYQDDWIYWCDAYFGTVERARFNGADRKIIIQGDAIRHPYGVAVFGRTLLWTNLRDAKINAVELDSNGEFKSPPRTVYDDPSAIFELHVFDPNEKVVANGSCSTSNGGCEQLCFATNCRGVADCNPKTCDCADGYSVDGNDPTKCTKDATAPVKSRCDETTQFECRRNHNCVDRSVLCDGDDDCGDGTEGGVCHDFTCKSPEQFRCVSSNQCIDPQWVCDGDADCRSGEDETTELCGRKPACPKNKFLCEKSGRCIPQRWKCDGELDCGQGDTSDEKDCEAPLECGVGQFRCLNGKCILNSFVCDGQEDCRDGSDEANCKNGCIPGLQFRCSEGDACLSYRYLCDGVADCANGWDERNDTCPMSNEVECPYINQFKCRRSKQCIRAAFRCDGQSDCWDGSDEENCPELKCTVDQFACADRSKCVPLRFHCDGHMDCEDASDERSCPKVAMPNSERCVSPNYLCLNDTKATCIPHDKVCNGAYDCPNQDDEGFLCEENMCKESTCDHLCHNRPTGYVCSCRDGYTLAEDGSKCHKSDPCSFGACSQECEAHGSHRVCSCTTGYELLHDKFTCKSTASDDPYLVYTNRYDIRLLRLSSHVGKESPGISSSDLDQQSLPLLSQLRNTIALDYYFENATNVLLFWSDIATDQIFTGRVSSGVLVDVKPIVTYGIWTAEGLAVDWLGRNVYWVDSLLDQIEVTNFDGSFSATILNGDMHNLRALALDPSKGLMFWTDWQEENPRIERATMAGNDRRLLYRVSAVVGGGWPNGLTCDYLAERLYWIDAKSDSIHTISYEGKDHREVLRDGAHVAHPFAIAVFENHVYWTDWRNTDIYRANKWNGSEITLVENTSNQPFDLKVVHSSRQTRAIKNPCRDDNGGCSHLCLIESATERRCACPHLMTLASGQGIQDRTRCVPINQTLVFASSTTITAVDLDYPNRIVFPLLAGKGVENITALAVDPRRTTIFWTDQYSARINMLQMNYGSKAEQKVLLRSGAANCFGLAVDQKLGLLYYTGWTRAADSEASSAAWISVISGNGTFMKTVVHSTSTKALRNPKDIVLVPDIGEMYWLDVGYDPPALFHSSLDGRKVTVLPLDHIDANATIGAESLTVDTRQQRLFWAQPSRNLTRVLELASMTLHTIDFANDPLASPSILALDDDGHEIIFYDRISGNITARMISTNYVAGGKAFELRRSSRLLREGSRNLVAMKIMDRAVLEEDDEADQCDTLACDQLCVRSYKERKCVCADGYQRVNGKCKAPESQLVFSTSSNNIHWLLNDHDQKEASGPFVVPLSGNEAALLSPRWLEVDAQKEKIYLIDTKLNELWQFRWNGSHPRKVLSGGSARLSGLAVDRFSGYIYVSSFVPMLPGRPVTSFVQVVHPELEDLRKELVREWNQTISGLAIDAVNGYLFWISRTGIMKCRLDGSNITTVVGNEPFSSKIAVDCASSRVFYLTMDMKTLHTVDYEGRNKQIASQGDSVLEAIVADSGVFYYATRRSISRVEIASGGLLKNESAKEVGTSPTPVRELKVYDMRPRKSPSRCVDNNGGCEQLCYNMGSGQSHRCDCVYSRLGHDGTTCESYRSFVAFARGSIVEFAPNFGPLDMDPNHLSITAALERKELLDAFKPVTSSEILRGPVALANDQTRYQLLFSDIQANRIVAVKYDQSEHFVVAQDVGKVEGMAFDEVHRDLYFTAGRTIQRVSLAETALKAYPKKPAVLLTLGELDRPRGIAVDPCRMLIYFSNWRSDFPSIERVFFSGYKRERIVATDIQTPNALAIDFAAAKIYWADARLDRIERMDFDGTHREIVIESRNDSRVTMSEPLHPFGLAVYGDLLYYTDWVMRAVISVNKLTGENSMTLRGNMTEQPMGIVVVADDLPKCGSDACTKQADALKCEDTCRTTATGIPHCACNGERQLNADNRTCSGSAESTCAVDEFVCSSTGRCIPYEETCDGVAECPYGEDEFIEYCVDRQCREGYFSCGNGICIAASKRCNKVNDCGNFEDELDCECNATEFRCKNGMCIAADKRCNFEKDCSDATDEMGCAARNCSHDAVHNKTMLSCPHTTQCILPEWLCDGNNDCWDEWDEQECPSAVIKLPWDNGLKQRDCTSDEHQCNGTRTCIPKSYVCDGSKDCASGSDEENCESECNAKTEFTCPIAKKCIDAELVCDGHRDCLDGADEANCTEKCNQKKSFLCANGHCIPKKWVCDGVNDCLDQENGQQWSSDERNCTNDPTTKASCRPNEFLCKSKRAKADAYCIPESAFCDGENDCADGSDEPAGCADRQCNTDEFRCKSGQCVPYNWTCNDIPDCRDESDESALLCQDPLSGQICKPGEFQCANGVCLPNADQMLCDKKNDCGDWSDEKQCNVSVCLRDSPCSHTCVDKKIGYQCICPEHMELSEDKRTCKFKDRCEDFPCSQHCVHFSGRSSKPRYKCACDSGYRLDVDAKTCRHDDKIRPEILLVSRRSLRLFTITGHPKATLLSNLSNGVAVDYDWRSRNAYFSQVSPIGSYIGRTSLTLGDADDKAELKVLSSIPVTSPESIFIDYLSGNIIWCDRSYKAISMTDKDGRFIRILLKGDPLMDPRAVAGDPAKGLIFWADWGNVPHIGRLSMTTSEATVIVNSSLKWPSALAVDRPSKRVYWGDASLGYIGSCDYDGSHRRLVLRKTVGRIFAMSVFEQYVYWTEWTNRTVQRAHKVSGAEQKTAISSQLYRPMGLQVVHPLLQASTEPLHPCATTPPICENLCIPSTEAPYFQCACAEGFRLEGKARCVPDCRPTEFACRKTFKCLPFFWRCDGQDDCGDGEDEPASCPPFQCVPGQMQCTSSNTTTAAAGSKKCITHEEICDGNKDCPGGDDESVELCAAYQCMEEQYKCPNSPKCLSLTAVCDGRNDCDDGSDEKNCANVLQLCASHHYFTCLDAHGKPERCISHSWICDGEKDCPTGDDEPARCGLPLCANGTLECGSGLHRRCVDHSKVCDGNVDCADGRDESREMCERHTCSSFEFRCSSGKCVPLSWRCDGQKDCDDGADEAECAGSSRCAEDHFTCKSDGRCILSKFKCDGQQDCEDGSDEADCGPSSPTDSPCPVGSTPCANGQKCYKDHQKCDGKADCDDFSDEAHCEICPAKTFRCLQPSSQCVPLASVCDSKLDCQDGSDELYCSCWPEFSLTQSNGFACGTGNETAHNRLQCIDRSKVCDGIRDCPNGKDEEGAVCQLHICPESHLKCGDGQCYPHSGFCDGVPDCVDLSDEKNDYCTTKCGNDSFRCDNGLCISSKLQCDGRNQCGDNSDEANCGHGCDVVEVCPQQCYGGGGGVKCACDPGYTLELIGSRVRCRASDSELTRVIVLDGILTRQFRSRPGVKNLDILTVEKNIPTFDYVSHDGKNATFYWIDANDYEVHVGSVEEMLDAKTSPKPRRGRSSAYWEENLSASLAVDWVNKNLYTVRRKVHGVHSINADMAIRASSLRNVTNFVEIAIGNLHHVTSIAVSPRAGKLYWSVQRPHPAIEYADLDGSNRATFALENVYEPSSLVVDEPNKRVYWTDAQKGTIESAVLDGRHRRVVRKYGYQGGIFHDRPSAIDIFEDNVYVVGQPNGTVWKMHKFGRVIGETPVKRLLVTYPEAKIKLVHPVKRYAAVEGNPCANLTKSVCGQQPCILVGQTPKCICPEGTFFDGKTCTQVRVLFGREQVACGSKRCLNGGICEFPSKCICPAGIGGDQCEHNPCHHACLNNGTCLLRYEAASRSTSVVCSCPLEYSGSRCERYKCTGLCGAHGSCRVDAHGKPTCTCDEGWSGPDCANKTDGCIDFCHNGGECFESTDGRPFCKCPEYYQGRRCENCFHQHSKDFVVCRNGGYCKDRLACECPTGFSGNECERDMCKNFCLNGGECLRNSSEPNGIGCKCPAGYKGERCELDFCRQNRGYCLNGGICTVAADGKPECVCRNRFQGERCQNPRACQDYCLNESDCEEKSESEWQCKCKPGYSGERCDIYERCNNMCENGAKCRLDERIGPVCECPKGLNGTRCDNNAAQSCAELECHHGLCIKTVYGAECICHDGWVGLVCNTPSCDRPCPACEPYCTNGGSCFVLGGRPLCECPEGTLGARCDQTLEEKVALEGLAKKQSPGKGMLSVAVPLVMFMALGMLVLYCFVVKRDMRGKKLFQHTRMMNEAEVPDADLEEFQNPAYLAGDEDDRLHVTEATHFTNPVYEGVYNDTVTVSSSKPSTSRDDLGSLMKPNTERFNLLSKPGDPLQDE